MAKIRWLPGKDLKVLHDRVDRLLGGTFATSHAFDTGVTQIAFRPMVDIIETKDTIVIQAEIPGVCREDIDIEVTGNQLTLKGNRTPREQFEDEHYYRSERVFGRFKRVFPLPTLVNPSEIEASIKNGILEILIPKPVPQKPNKIPID